MTSQVPVTFDSWADWVLSEINTLYTVADSNIAQIKLLEQSNWKLLDTVKNTKTNNIIRIYGRKI